MFDGKRNIVLSVLFSFFFLMVISAKASAEWTDRFLLLVSPEGKEIDNYCIAPLYSRSFTNGYSGVGYEERFTLIWPIYIGKYDTFKKMKEELKGTPQLPLFSPTWQIVGLTNPSGERFRWKVLLFLKPGYKPFEWDMSQMSLGTWKPPQILTLERGDSESVVQFLLSTNKDQTQLKKLYWSPRTTQDWEIVDGYTDADREALRKCYYEEAVDRPAIGKQPDEK